MTQDRRRGFLEDYASQVYLPDSISRLLDRVHESWERFHGLEVHRPQMLGYVWLEVLMRQRERDLCTGLRAIPAHRERTAPIHPVKRVPYSNQKGAIMAFSDETKRDALRRSGGRCECTRREHTSHSGRCNSPVSMATAEFHHVTVQSVGGHDGLSNCEVLCHSCHVATDSYGRS